MFHIDPSRGGSVPDAAGRRVYHENAMSEPVTIAVLAGGQSIRMGRDKALLEVGGIPIIERIMSRVRLLGDEAFLITNTPNAYANLGMIMLPDMIPGKGPLGGLYTALHAARNSHVLLVSCDQPFLNPELLRYLISLREGVDVVVPLAEDGYPQALHAVYGKSCLPAVRHAIYANQLKMIGWFEAVNVRDVVGSDITDIDPDRYSFVNVNTPEDLAYAEELAAELD